MPEDNVDDSHLHFLDEDWPVHIDAKTGQVAYAKVYPPDPFRGAILVVSSPNENSPADHMILDWHPLLELDPWAHKFITSSGYTRAPKPAEVNGPTQNIGPGNVWPATWKTLKVCDEDGDEFYLIVIATNMWPADDD